MNDKMKHLLIEDLENKKHSTSFRDIPCDCCGEIIEQDESFVWMGEKRKICLKCVNDIEEGL